MGKNSLAKEKNTNSNSLTPDYLLSLVPENVGNNSAYNLRNARNLNTIQAHSKLYYKFFLPSVTHDWNGLSEEIRNSPRLSSFKHHLDANLTNSLIFFFDGKRVGQIYHARLRMRCSSLNAYLFFQKHHRHVCHLKTHDTSCFLVPVTHLYVKNWSTKSNLYVSSP